MELVRHNNTCFFKSTALNNALLFIHADYQQNTIKLETLFNTRAGAPNFLLLFLYKGFTDAILNSSQPALTEKVNDNKGLLWLTEYGNELNTKSQPIITISSDNLAEMADIAFEEIQINPNFADIRVTYNTTKDLVEFAGNIPLSLVTYHNENECGFRNFNVSIKDDPGAINFAGSVVPGKSLIQPESPFVKKTTVVDVKYFVQEDINQFAKLTVKLFPYQIENINEAEFVSEITYSLEQDAKLKSNFIDETGANYTTQTEFRSKLSFVEYAKTGGGYSTKKYRFIPTGPYVLQAEGGANMLIGKSGTERVSLNGKSITLDFKDEKRVRISDDEEGLEVSRNSMTSFVRFADNTPVYLDSERSPLFDNDKKSSLQGAIQSEVIYSPITVGSSFKNAVPIIPTLSFNGNSNLRVLERVFAKDRLSSFKLAKSSSKVDLKSYITPQGFRRDGTALNFIQNRGSVPGSGGTGQGFKKAKASRAVKFEIDGVNLASDFYFSLTQDEVFFVVTAKMLKQIKKEKISAVFQIDSFVIDLVDFNAEASVPKKLTEETVLIFKFGTGTVADLVKDSSKWSNHGDYKVGIDADLKNRVAHLVDFPENQEYKYFNEKIKTNPGWNGVLILNVPLANEDNLPQIFKGLSNSQELNANANNNPQIPGDKLLLKTGMKFQYVSFSTNKTAVKDGKVNIVTTLYDAMIDYDLINTPQLGKSVDYDTVSKHFENVKSDIKTYRFLLTKLLVRFESSRIVSFKSFAFLQIPDVFENKVTFDNLLLAHPNASIPNPHSKPNFIRLEGNYQKAENDSAEFNFTVQTNLLIKFDDSTGNKKSILKNISVSKISFTYSGNDQYRFDINASAGLESWLLADLISIDELKFENIGFKFTLGKKLPCLAFDVSKLLIFPKLSYTGDGFLRSFPLKFSYFDTFKFTRINSKELNIDYDFFTLPGIEIPDIPDGSISNLFSFVFDFDLGSLGNLGSLKGLKGQILAGWSANGGFALAFKLNGPSKDGLHLNLFGGVKLDVKDLKYGTFKPPLSDKCNAYYLRLVDARITLHDKPLPDENHAFNGIIIADFSKTSKKIAWLITYAKTTADKELVLALGQRMGPLLDSSINTTVAAIENVRSTFDVDLKDVDLCKQPDIADKLNFRPERNWIIASERILPKSWPVDLKVIFNDPYIYGLRLGLKGEFLKGFSIDILYRKLSENLGVYNTEIRLPDSLRNQELGGGSLTLPDIGVQIFTNGDWKVDIGFPRSGNDWSRSGFLQLRTAPPFVGFFGFYMMMSRVASLTLFKGYISDSYSTDKLQIIQAGFAMRVGLGYYFNKGILFAGASITVYGILEGSFAFEKEESGLQSVFPDHFAVFGRTGAIAELIGYVDFKIIKASVHLSLSAEFGMLIVYIGRDNVIAAGGGVLKKGMQPVLVYVQGNVTVKVTIKVGCVKISLRFSKTLRFEYTIGGSSSNKSFLALNQFNLPSLKWLPAVKETVTITGIKEVPVIYLPAFTKVNDGTGEQLKMVHYFMIPFFGKGTEADDETQVVTSARNILTTKIIIPFIEDLIEQLNALGIPEANKYETLRSVLVTGKILRDINDINTQVEIDIKIDGYLPTFIQGINSGEKDVVNKILETHFLFDRNEIKPDAPDNSLNKKYNAEHLLIPAPISKNIQIVDADNDVKFKTDKGFTVSVKGLVNDQDGLDKVTCNIDKIIDYDDDTIDYMETFFDSYKTQFLERGEQSSNLARFENKDIREEIIIPEFFKLIGLLSLEAFFEDTNPNKKNREPFNPEIRINADGNFEYGKDVWETNKSLTSIVGQLNYFYNSGLRLPTETNASSTEAIYKILKQESLIHRLSQPDVDKIAVSIDNVEITDQVFASPAAKRDMLTFVDAFETGFSLKKLKDEFHPIAFTQPFKFVDVTLAIQYGKLGIPSECRFFDLPTKLGQHSADQAKFAFNLNYTSYNGEKGADKVELSTKEKTLKGFSKCLNVTFKVRKHKDKVLEIIGVTADDLNLMNSLHNDSFKIDAIDFYYRHESASDNMNDSVQIDRIIDDFATILKTNLSPRTAPPLFNELNKFKTIAGSEERKYWEDSNNDQENFSRLMWESLTTNNGGYYLLLDKKVKFKKDAQNVEMTTGIIMASFELHDINAEAPAYFNALKFDLLADPANTTIINNLKEGSHYLYLDNILLTDRNVSNKLVVEYHPTIPAHTFGIEVTRDRTVNTKSNYNNYLPLEFSISEVGQTEILSADKVLPIMPTNKDDVDTNLYYNHVSPLVTPDPKIKDVGNYGRYSKVGKKFAVRTNLRDVFGYRTSANGEFLDTAVYNHVYFDKLVPLESWPLTTFSCWVKSYAKDVLSLEVSCQYNVMQVLGLAGVEHPYGYNESISEEDRDKLKLVIPGILNNLYTIIAQLSDENTVAEINGTNLQQTAQKQWNIKLKQLVTDLTHISNKSMMPALPIGSDQFTVEIKTGFELKRELRVDLRLFRDKNNLHQTDNSLFKASKARNISLSDLTAPYVWDYEATNQISTVIKFANTGDPGKSTLVDLNEAIRHLSANDYCIGISSALQEDKLTGQMLSNKIIYLISEKNVSSIKADHQDCVFRDENYYGIKPFSNHLWTGTYKSRFEDKEKSFSNTDLDKALRIVLEKIDSLLYAGQLPSEIEAQPGKNPVEVKAMYNELLRAKKRLVEAKLKHQVDWVMVRGMVDDDLTKEFRDLLLSGLTNFYDYDGMIRTRCTGLEILTERDADGDVITNHRLNISFDERPLNGKDEKGSQRNYNLISSKIGDHADEWYILFDQLEGIDENINFDLRPMVTHLEYDYIDVDNESEIQQSTWIQLLTPIHLKDDTYTVSGWKKIVRKFPDKPIIIEHFAQQKYADETAEAKTWDPDFLGLWNYNLCIEDRYEINDKMIVDLIVETSLKAELDDLPNLEGLLAYWSAYFIDPGINSGDVMKFMRSFTLELDFHLAGLERQNEQKSPVKQDRSTYNFTLERYDSEAWRCVDSNLPVDIKVSTSNKEMFIEVGPFNVLQEAKRVISVSPLVKVSRNTHAANKGFHYITESVKPLKPAVPNISYLKPNKVKEGQNLDQAYQLLASMNLPYKSMAKLLIGISDLDQNREEKLPIIPIRQMEIAPKGSPLITPELPGGELITVDEMFDKYTNGYPAISVTIYNDDLNNDLPIFYADSIYKQKQ